MSQSYGPIHHESLKQSRSDVYRELERGGQRFAYFKSAAKDAEALHTTIVEQMAKAHPFSAAEFGTEERWRRWLEQVTRELVLNDRILVPDEEYERAQRDGYLD